MLKKPSVLCRQNVVSEERVEEGTQHTALWCASMLGDLLPMK